MPTALNCDDCPAALRTLQKKVRVPSQHTTVVVSSTLYKPSKKHKQGMLTQELTLSHKELKLLILFDLNFEGTCLDHQSEHPLVHEESLCGSNTVMMIL